MCEASFLRHPLGCSCVDFFNVRFFLFLSLSHVKVKIAEHYEELPRGDPD